MLDRRGERARAVLDVVSGKSREGEREVPKGDF